MALHISAPPSTEVLPTLPPPGSTEARRRGCLCSRSQNRAGDGGRGAHGLRRFFVLAWCPLHRDAELAPRVMYSTAAGAASRAARSSDWDFVDTRLGLLRAHEARNARGHLRRAWDGWRGRLLANWSTARL